MKQFGVDCARRRCIALAEAGQVYCAAHRTSKPVKNLLGDDEPDWSLGHLEPVIAYSRLEYESVVVPLSQRERA